METMHWNLLKFLENVTIIHMHLHMKQPLNGFMGIEKMQKWMKVVEANFLETVDWNLLKFLEHLAIIHMHLPLKQLGKWMHGFQVMEKTKFSLCIFISCSKT